MFPRRFHRKRYRRKTFFPFWIFFILFFVFMGKSGFWMWIFPFFLVWMFGPMLWGLTSGWREGEEEDPASSRSPIPPQWQTPPQPAREPMPPVKTGPAEPPLRSTAGLPTTCSSCGGPVNPTTLAWRTNTPHCGYCGTHLR
jgi:hypothetical protein